MPYLGEAVAVRASARHPFTEEVVPDLSGHVDFFAPGKNPQRNPNDRTPDVSNIPVSFDEEIEAYVAYVLTDGSPWEPGRWSYRVKLEGDNWKNWEYGNFQLRE